MNAIARPSIESLSAAVAARAFATSSDISFAQDIIREKMMEQVRNAPKMPQDVSYDRKPDRGLQRRIELAPKVIELHEQGMADLQIGLTLGCHKNTVARIISDHVPLEQQNGARSHKLVDRARAARQRIAGEVARLYQSGMSQQQVAERMGIGATTVGRILDENGVKVRDPGQSPARLAYFRARAANRDDLTDKVLRMTKAASSQRAIARKLGISATTVSRIIAENQIDLGSASEKMARAKRIPVTTTDGKTFACRRDACAHYGINSWRLRNHLLPDGRLDVSRLKEATA